MTKIIKFPFSSSGVGISLQGDGPKQELPPQPQPQPTYEPKEYLQAFERIQRKLNMNTTTKLPDDCEYIGMSPAMSNGSGTIDEGFAEKLKSGKFYGHHFGWNFCGDVWFQDGQFHEAVYCFHCYQETFSADTLEDLMEIVNSKYGAE